MQKFLLDTKNPDSELRQQKRPAPDAIGKFAKSALLSIILYMNSWSLSKPSNTLLDNGENRTFNKKIDAL